MLYVPVLHQGYVKLFEKYREASTLYLPGLSLINELGFMQREIRAMDPHLIAHLVRCSGLVRSVEVMEAQAMPDLASQTIVTVDEGFSRRMVSTYYPDTEVVYDTIFLRWDEAKVLVTAPADYDHISELPQDRQRMELAAGVGENSGDWWRRVGAVLVIGDSPSLTSHNRHVPSQLTPYSIGDPRDVTPAGQNPHIATTLHAEQGIITEAARRGVTLEGSQLYVTTFPCPMCAKQIGYAGIKRIYFQGGHASLDGLQILRDLQVEVIWVPRL